MRPPRLTSPETARPAGGQLRFGVLLITSALLLIWLLAGPQSVRPLVGGTVIFASLLLTGARWAVAGWGWSLRAAAADSALALSMFVVILADVHWVSLLGAIWLLVVGVIVPGQIIRALLKRGVIDVQALLGAITVYVLLGVSFAMALTIAGLVESTATLILAGTAGDGTFRDVVYFSFITLSTTGYGDITPLSGTARALSVVEAVGGQIYLVTAVALVVGALTSNHTKSDAD